MPRFGWPRKKPDKTSAEDALIAEAASYANAGFEMAAPVMPALVR